MISPIQTFKSVEIHRRQIKNAPYSPHYLTPEQRERLNASLEEFGLVNSFVWNPLTENLISGNQRLGIVDALSQTGDDYSLTVDAVELDEDREKALSLILNARGPQGEDDETLLAGLLAELDGKLSFDLEAIIGEAQEKTAATLRTVTILPPPKMAWVLIGIPVVEFGAIAAHVEAIARIPETIVENSLNDAGRQDGQS